MKLLILQHVAHEPLGYIAEYAREKGISLDVVKLWEPYTLPSQQGYAGVIVMGGPMGVYENFPSKADEIALIKNTVGRVPLLGVCLGGQLLAYALGAKVYKNPGGKEIGYYNLELTGAGLRSLILTGFRQTIRALQWHGDAFDLPEGAELLATSSICRNQAFSYKNAYGFLFHLEFTPDMVRDLIAFDKTWIHTDFDLDESKLLKEADELTGAMKQQCYRLLDNFLR